MRISSLACGTLAVVLRATSVFAQRVDVGVDISAPTGPMRPLDLHVAVRVHPTTSVSVEGELLGTEWLSYRPMEGHEARTCGLPCHFDTWIGPLGWALDDTVLARRANVVTLQPGSNAFHLMHPNRYAHGGGSALLGVSVPLGVIALFVTCWFATELNAASSNGTMDGFLASFAAFGISVFGMIEGARLRAADTTPRLERIARTIQVGAGHVAGGGVGMISARF